MKRQRVIQLVSNTSVGGVQVLVEMIEAGLTEHGIDVTTLSLGATGSLLHRLRHLTRTLWTIITARADALFTYHAAASVIGCSLAAIVRVPLRAAHQTAIPSAIKSGWRRLDRLSGSLGGYTHTVINSNATGIAFDHYPARYRQRFVLIPHGVTPVRPLGRRNWRRDLGISATATVLVATGRLTDQKNHAVAVAALRLLPEAHLLIAGDGPNRMALHHAGQAVPGRLHLVGEIARADIGDVLGAGDIYVFPSVWETFGLSGVEAGMAGLPIVAADLPVLREVLDFCPETGLVRFHPPDDAAAFADAVRSLQVTPEQRLRQAVRFRARHGADTMIERYLALLASARDSK